MTHFCFLRALGLILISALVVNITVVLAAPFYLKPEDSQVTTTETVESRASADQSADPASDGGAGEIPAIEELADQAAVIPVEDGDTEGQVGSSQLDTAVQRERASLNPIQALDVEPSSKQLLTLLGAGMGKTSTRLQHHIAATAKRLAASGIADSTRDQHRDNTSETSSNTVPSETMSVSDEASPIVDTSVNEPPMAQIVLTNPQRNAMSVSFLLDGKIQTLLPGARLIETGSGLSIQFDRGGNFGVYQEELSAGSYEFDVARSGWTLNAQTD